MHWIRLNPVGPFHATLCGHRALRVHGSAPSRSSAVALGRACRPQITIHQRSRHGSIFHLRFVPPLTFSVPSATEEYWFKFWVRGLCPRASEQLRHNPACGSAYLSVPSAAPFFSGRTGHDPLKCARPLSQLRELRHRCHLNVDKTPLAPRFDAAEWRCVWHRAFQRVRIAQVAASSFRAVQRLPPPPDRISRRVSEFQLRPDFLLRLIPHG